MTRFQYLFGLAFTGAMALAGGFVATLVMQPTQSVLAQENPGVITATELRIVDEKGTVRVLLGVGKKGAALTLRDEEARDRLVALAELNGSRLFLADSSKEERYSVGYADKSDTVFEAVSDAEGNIRIMSTLQPKLGALFALQEGEGKKQVAIQAMEGLSTVQLYSGSHEIHASALRDSGGMFFIKQGKLARYRIGTTTKGAPEMIFNDGNGDWGIVAALTDDNRPVFALAKDGKIRLRALTGVDGSPTLEMLDKEQKTTWKAVQDPEETPPKPETPESE